MSKAKDTATAVLTEAKSLGWNISVRKDVVEITKQFTPGDQDAFVQADGEYYRILSLIPQTASGSMWGTDGGGVGAISALNNGLFSMKMSGCSKRVVSALNKMIGV